MRVTDCLPKQLCLPCNKKLSVCFDFAETCIRAENKLKRIHSVDGNFKKIYNNYVDISDDKTESYKQIYCSLRIKQYVKCCQYNREINIANH